MRELTRAWVDAPDAYPMPQLVKLVHARKSELIKLWDELLVMRKSETVAHGASGTRAALDQILEKRVPQLARTFVLLEPLFASLRLVATRKHEDAHADDASETQSDASASPIRMASLLVGPTPRGAKFRRVEISASGSFTGDQLLLVDESGAPKLALSPLAILSSESTHEETLFLLDGPAKRGALYVAFPSMLEHRDPEGFAGLAELLPDEDDAPKSERAGANTPERPYRGLASFGPEESALFFGREAETQTLANRIRRCGFVTVTGASGSGKTSLLRAGVLPLLSDVTVAFVRPGAHPLASFVNRVSEALEVPRADLEALVHKPNELRALVEETVRKTSQWFVLVVDQAEEVLTVTADATEREAFGRVLRALGHSESKTRVVLSIREDFFARLATIAPLAGVFSREVEVVTTPNRDALIRILLGPAKAFGYTFEDEELVLALIDSVAEANAALALLSFAADRLWEARDRKWKRLTRAAYDAQGGVKGALASHADAVLGALSSSEASTCRSMFLALTTPDKTRAIVLRTELVGGARDAAEAERVLERLVAARLLTTTEDAAGASTIEIVHEALIAHWQKLAGWLSEDEEGQRLRHALRQAAREWEARARPRGLLWRGEALVEMRVFLKRLRDPLLPAEQAFVDACTAQEVGEKRVRRLLIGGAFVALAVFAVFMVFQWQKATRATAEAEARRLETEREKKTAEIRALVAEARGLEAKGLVDEAHALYRAAVAVESELGTSWGAEETSREVLELARLETDAAGVLELPTLKRPAYQLATSPMHGLIAAAGSEDDLVVIDVASAKVTHRLAHPGLISGLELAPNEAWLASLSHDLERRAALLRVYELPSMKLVLEREKLPAALGGIGFATDGDALFVGTSEGVLEFSLPSGEVTRRGGRDGAAMSPGAAGMLAISDASGVVLLDGSDRVLLSRPPGNSANPSANASTTASSFRVALSQDEELLAMVAASGKVEILRARTGEKLDHPIFITDKERAASLAFAGRSLVVTTMEGRVILYDVDTKRLQRISAGRSTPLVARGEDRLAIVRDNRAELFDLATGTRMSSRPGHEGQINQVALYGDRLLTTGWDKRVRLEASDAVRPVAPLASFPPGLYLSVVSEAGDRIAYASNSIAEFKLGWHDVSDSAPTLERHRGTPIALRGDPSLSRLVLLTESELRLFDGRLAQGAASRALPVIAPLPVITRHPAIDVTRDLSTIVVGDEHGGLFITNFAGEERARYPELHGDRVTHITLSPDGALAASVGQDRAVNVTRLSDGANLLTWDAQFVNTQLAFSPDGRLFAIATEGSLAFFDVASGFEVVAYDPIEDLSPSCIAFSPDSKAFALGTTSSSDVSVRRYDLVELTRAPLDIDEGTLSVAFSSDGRRVVGAGSLGGVMSWQDGLSPARRARIDAGGDATVVPIAGTDDVWVLGATPTRVHLPLASRAPILENSSLHTNLRVCRDSMKVVHGGGVSAWADANACAEIP